MISDYFDPSKPDIKPEATDYKIDPVETSEAVRAKDEDPDEQKRKKRQHPSFHEENLAHFKELTKAVEEAHHLLLKRNSPYRFCVYQEGKEILIDIVKLNAQGNIHETIKKNITHEDFYQWLERIEEGEGLFIDESI